MVKEDIRFEVDQLRKDKIIYAVESCAVTLICIFMYWSSSHFMGDNQISELIKSGSIVLAIGYTLYMGIGNFYRLARVKKLEKELQKIIN